MMNKEEVVAKLRGKSDNLDGEDLLVLGGIDDFGKRRKTVDQRGGNICTM